MQHPEQPLTIEISPNQGFEKHPACYAELILIVYKSALLLPTSQKSANTHSQTLAPDITPPHSITCRQTTPNHNTRPDDRKDKNGNHHPPIFRNRHPPIHQTQEPRERRQGNHEKPHLRAIHRADPLLDPPARNRTIRRSHAQKEAHHNSRSRTQPITRARRRAEHHGPSGIRDRGDHHPWGVPHAESHR